MILFTITCITILACCIQGKDVNSKLEELKNTDWGKHAAKLYSKIKEHAKKIGRYACGHALMLWYVLQDSKTTTLEKVLICGAILYIVSKESLISAKVHKILGLADEGLAAIYVINKVKDKMTPEIEKKVQDVLYDWFGPEYKDIMVY